MTRRQWATFLLAVLLLVGAVPTMAAGTLLRVQPYDQLIDGLMQDTNAARAVFARSALHYLQTAYERELRRAAGTLPPDPVARNSVYSWMGATRRYISELAGIAARIDERTMVTLLRDADGAVRIILPFDAVSLTAPQLDGTAEFERGVTDYVCQELHCDAVYAAFAAKTRQRRDETQTTWEFSDRAPSAYRAGDGLECRFADRTHLNLKRQACERVLDEVRQLGDSLRNVRDLGRTIDWNSIKIHPGGSGRPHRVEFNGRGDHVELSLPLLFRTDPDLRRAKPWLRARLDGKVAIYVLELPPDVAYLN